MKLNPNLTEAENILIQLTDGLFNSPHDIVEYTGFSLPDAEELFLELTKIREKDKQ